MAWAPEIPLTPSMKLKAFTKPISHTAVTRVSTARSPARRCRGEMRRAAIPALPTHCRTSRRIAVTPRRSSTKPRAPKKPAAAPNGTAADPGHGHQEPDHDRKTAAARRRDGVGRPEARYVYGGQPAQQGDGQRLRGPDGNAAAHDGP